MKLKVKLFIVIILNIILFLVLFNIPINSKWLSNICLIKKITGNECWNCGMTRAFLSILHFDFYSAFEYNRNVIIVFPLTMMIYVYYIYKKILIK